MLLGVSRFSKKRDLTIDCVFWRLTFLGFFIVVIGLLTAIWRIRKKIQVDFCLFQSRSNKYFLASNHFSPSCLLNFHFSFPSYIVPISGVCSTKLQGFYEVDNRYAHSLHVIVKTNR